MTEQEIDNWLAEAEQVEDRWGTPDWPWRYMEAVEFLRNKLRETTRTNAELQSEVITMKTKLTRVFS